MNLFLSFNWIVSKDHWEDVEYTADTEYYSSLKNVHEKNENNYNYCSENKLSLVATDNFYATFFICTFSLKIVVPENEPHVIVRFSFSKSPKADMAIILIWVDITL